MNSDTVSHLKDAIRSGRRITADEALSLFDMELAELGALAHLRRDSAGRVGQVGFIIDRIINYSNVCEAQCLFCAYHAKAGRIAPYRLSIDEILRRTEELEAAGGSQVMLQGGLDPEYSLDDLVDMVRKMKESFPSIALHSFSPSELHFYSKRAGVSLDDALDRLQEAGLDSVPGASDLLVPRIRRKVSPKKATVDQWCQAIEALARHDMKTSATMTYGMGETLEERVAHLEVIRNLQDETGNIRAFIPWSFSPQNTAMEEVRPATGIEYLRIVAVARIFLDNIPYIQAGWLTEGMKLAQLALVMGANDMGGILTEELVVKATGVDRAASVDEVVDLIQNAGMAPVLRDSAYHEIRSYE